MADGAPDSKREPYFSTPDNSVIDEGETDGFKFSSNLDAIINQKRSRAHKMHSRYGTDEVVMHEIIDNKVLKQLNQKDWDI